MIRRLTYIDTTRAILITLVVLGYVLNYANPQYNIIPYTLAQEFINAFHMPAFFLLDRRRKVAQPPYRRVFCP